MVWGLRPVLVCRGSLGFAESRGGAGDFSSLLEGEGGGGERERAMVKRFWAKEIGRIWPIAK